MVTTFPVLWKMATRKSWLTGSLSRSLVHLTGIFCVPFPAVAGERRKKKKDGHHLFRGEKSCIQECLSIIGEPDSWINFWLKHQKDLRAGYLCVKEGIRMRFTEEYYKSSAFLETWLKQDAERAMRTEREENEMRERLDGTDGWTSGQP